MVGLKEDYLRIETCHLGRDSESTYTNDEVLKRAWEYSKLYKYIMMWSQNKKTFLYQENYRLAIITATILSPNQSSCMTDQQSCSTQ